MGRIDGVGWVLCAMMSVSLALSIFCSKEAEESFPSDTHTPKTRAAPYSSVLRADSADVETRLRVADLLAERGERRRAVAAYRQVIRMDSTCVTAYARMAMLLADLGKMTEAIAACQQAIARDSTALTAYNNLAALYGRMGRSALALDALNRALTVDSTYVVGVHNRGRVYYEMGRYADAEADLERALRIDPARAKVAMDLGKLYIDQHAYERAAGAFEHATAEGVQGASVHYYLAKAYGSLGQIEAAREEYARTIEADPDLPDAHYGLAMLLRREGKHAQADSQFAIFQRLRRRGGGSPEVIRRLKTLQERVFQHPDDLAARFDLGDLLARIGDLEAARRTFEGVLALQRKHIRAMNKIGHIYILQKHPEQALKMYERAIRTASDHAPSYLHAGDACLALGRSEEGMKHYQLSARWAPENPLPWYRLGVALMRKKRWAEADSALSRGLMLAEGNPKLQKMLDRAFRDLWARAPSEVP